MLERLRSQPRTARLLKAVLLGGLCGFLGMNVGAASAQDPTVQLRFSHWVPLNHPMNAGFKEWTDSVMEASGGSITITTFPAEQLGRTLDHYDMAASGIADIVWINPGLEPNRFPVASLLEMPFLVSDGHGGTRAIDEWYRDYAEREMSDVKFCLIHVFDPARIHSKRPLESRAAFQGLRIRAPAAPIAAFMEQLGASNVNIPAPEVRNALQQGIAEAITFPWNSVLSFGIEDIVNYHMDVPLFVSGFALLLNRNSYERMADGQKAVIDEHCTSEWAYRFGYGWIAAEVKGKQTLADRDGHTIYPVSAENLAEFDAPALAVIAGWRTRAEQAGFDPDEVFSSLVEKLQRENALAEGEANLYLTDAQSGQGR